MGNKLSLVAFKNNKRIFIPDFIDPAIRGVHLGKRAPIAQQHPGVPPISNTRDLFEGPQ